MTNGKLFQDLGIVGTSPAFLRVLDLVGRYASCDVPVLIHGETGTGKEVMARALHYLSARHDRPFVPINCGALPDSLIENELFGHSRGAYTDARAPQKGLVAQAAGGTLLFDEIDTLSRKSQVTLLRFLQDRKFRPLGSDTTEQADIRVIAATNADIGTLIGEGSFRQDLLFRLDVAPLCIPPLRGRVADIPLLARHFSARFAGEYGVPVPRFGEGVEQTLMRYTWPGNVRELENTMHRAVILAEDGVMRTVTMGVLARTQSESHDAVPDATMSDMVSEIDFSAGMKQARARCLARFERSYLQWLLAQTSGNISEAARSAGAERRHLGRMIKRSGLSADAFRSG